MGTLSNQPPRNYRNVELEDLDDFLSTAVEISKKHKISVSDVIAASRVPQLKRANDLYVANGDAFDEQIAGIGELVEKVASAIEGASTP